MAEIEVFYDGDCPLCVREIRLLQKLDRRRSIQFTDISQPSFDPERYGRTRSTFMGHIQGRAGGEWIEGVEVFRRLYSAVGLGPLVAVSRLPGVRHLAEVGYQWFARNRLRLTGREDVCTSEVCGVHRHPGR
jgi:predicted DCC family thiol-disulfide oxidoreductase YuxK